MNQKGTQHEREKIKDYCFAIMKRVEEKLRTAIKENWITNRWRQAFEKELGDAKVNMTPTGMLVY